LQEPVSEKFRSENPKEEDKGGGRGEEEEKEEEESGYLPGVED